MVKILHGNDFGEKFMQTKIDLKKIGSKKIILQENKSVDIFAFLSLEKDEKFDGELSVIHFGKFSRSKIVVRIILSDYSSAKFFGKVQMEKGAKKANSNLDIKVLLLSNTAKIFAEPIVEVFENDVEGAGHGLTISGVPKKELNFLMARGICEKSAKELVREGFLGG
ncbi:MAG: hypothetical protein Fur0024_3130 [Patescibacteria group bacterium]